MARHERSSLRIGPIGRRGTTRSSGLCLGRDSPKSSALWLGLAHSGAEWTGGSGRRVTTQVARRPWEVSASGGGSTAQEDKDDGGDLIQPDMDAYDRIRSNLDIGEPSCPLARMRATSAQSGGWWWSRGREPATARTATETA